MCGRTRIALAPEQVEQLTGVPRERWTDRERYRPSHNVSPGAWTPILRLNEQQQQPMLQSMRWGLIPSFTKPGAPLDYFKMFNARSESVAEKSSFSRLLPSRRCVVLLDGFYEWKADAGGKKQPYYISFGEGSVLRVAGLYDVFAGGEDGPLATYTMLTVDASPRLEWLHNRMPVLLQDDAAVAAWLGAGAAGGGSKQQVPLHLCAPCNSEALVWWPVTRAMSRPDYDKPDASEDMRTRKGSITSFFKPVVKREPQQQEQQQPVQQQPQQQEQPPPAKQEQQQQQHPVKQQQQQQQPVKQEQQSPGQQAAAGGEEARNPDEQQGPMPADEAAGAEQLAGHGRKRLMMMAATVEAPEGSADAETDAGSPHNKKARA